MFHALILAVVLLATFVITYSVLSQKGLMPSVSRLERGGWAMLLAGVTAGAALASVLYQGPFFIADSNGVVQVTVGSGSSSAVVPGGYVTFSRGGLVFADTNTNTTTWGTFTAPPSTSTAISVTFATAEPDTNYEILLTTKGITTTNGASQGFSVGDKYTNSFQVINAGKHISPIGGTFLKFRTSTP